MKQPLEPLAMVSSDCDTEQPDYFGDDAEDEFIDLCSQEEHSSDSDETHPPPSPHQAPNCAVVNLVDDSDDDLSLGHVRQTRTQPRRQLEVAPPQPPPPQPPSLQRNGGRTSIGVFDVYQCFCQRGEPPEAMLRRVGKQAVVEKALEALAKGLTVVNDDCLRMPGPSFEPSHELAQQTEAAQSMSASYNSRGKENGPFKCGGSSQFEKIVNGTAKSRRPGRQFGGGGGGFRSKKKRKR